MKPASEIDRTVRMVEQSTVPAALQRLTDAGIPFADLNGGNPVIVADKFAFNPSTGYWREIGVSNRHGYTVAALIAQIRIDAAGVTDKLEAVLSATTLAGPTL